MKRVLIALSLVLLLLVCLVRAAGTIEAVHRLTSTAGYGCSLYTATPNPCDPDSNN